MGVEMVPQNSPDLLEAITAATMYEVALREQEYGMAELEKAAVEINPRGKAFRLNLTGESGFNVIAECKRRSPSRGVLCEDYRAEVIARSYEHAGASAISVLTEPAFFGGDLRDLELVRLAVSLPVLQKEFIVSRYQLLEARVRGADAVLLIVAALNDSTLRELHRTAAEYGLAVLVEVHNSEELLRAVDAGAEIIGVNNRNLRSLSVNLEASHSLITEIPKAVVSVAESGLRDQRDLVSLKAVGYDAFLVGEALMSQEDPGQALTGFLKGAGGISGDG
jgi:indole-3-glycerol phosphate synthase